jgi:hypothetical protein
MSKCKRKSRATWLTIELPSNGLNYEQCGDSEASSHIEYITGSDDFEYHEDDLRFEMNHPEALRLSADTLLCMLWDCTDNSKLVETMHSYHTDAFDKFASEDLGFDLGLRHVGGDMAEVKLSVAKRLLAKCRKADGFATFALLYEEEARYGYKHGDNDPVARAKSVELTNWDACELGWLLSSALKMRAEKSLPGLTEFEIRGRRAAGLHTTHWVPAQSSREFDERVFYAMYEDDGEHQAWSAAVDWEKYEEKVKDARQDLINELPEEQRVKGQFPFRRCPLTLELPLAA